MMLTYISQLEAMANNAAENAAEQMKTPTLEDGKGKRLKKTAETFENMFPSDVREPEEADGNVSDPEEAQLGPRQLSFPTEEAQLGPRQRNGNHRPEAHEEAQLIMFTHISQLEAMDSHFPQPPLPPPLTEAEAMPAPPRPEQLSDMDAGGNPRGNPRERMARTLCVPGSRTLFPMCAAQTAMGMFIAAYHLGMNSNRSGESLRG